jgi:flagellar basal body-associated protein FliL
MKSEIIVILVMVALAVGGLVYLEMHSRRNKRSEEQQSKSVDTD